MNMLEKLSPEKKITRKNLYILIAAFLLMVIFVNIPLPNSITVLDKAELTHYGQSVIGVLIFCLILWATEAIPFHITAFLGMIFITVFSIPDWKFVDIVKSGFGSDTSVFFIGILALSSIITFSGLGKRISMFILSITGNRASMILLGFLIAGVVLSSWITNMAVSAMLVPLAVSILKEEGCKPLKSNFGKALLISCAFGPTIGGMTTPAGSGSNVIAMNLMQNAGININFLEWMKYGVPSALLLIIPTWLVLLLLFKPEITHLKKSNKELHDNFKTLPKISRDEIVTIIIFLATIAIWVLTPVLEPLLGFSIPTSLPALLAASLFFLPGMISIKWKDVEADISWSGIVLILAGIGIGTVLDKTGAAGWISQVLLGGVGGLGPLMQTFIIILVVCVMKIIFSSNTVTSVIIIPIVIALSLNYGINPAVLALPAGISSSLALIMVTSSPTNVIPFAEGYFTIGDMAKSGIILSIIASAITALVMFVIGSASGLYV